MTSRPFCRAKIMAIVAAYLVIFGAAVRADGSPSGSLVRRVEGALAFARTIANARFIATGGIGRHGPAEAVVIRDLLMRGGIAEPDIFLEDKAHDTLDSIERCHAILAQHADVELVVPCTSRYHQPRCAALFSLLGYAVRVPPMPAERPQLPLLKWVLYMMKEFVALPYDAVLLLIRHRVMRSIAPP